MKIVKMSKLWIVLVIAGLFFVSCGSNQQIETITVASQRGDCVGVAPMQCLLVKRTGQNDWEYLYQEIEGFNYEPGYEYVIEVVKQTIDNPAADQSSVRYIMEKEVSKTAKTSDNLPMR